MKKTNVLVCFSVFLLTLAGGPLARAETGTCQTLRDGLYVSDQDADSIHDGGSFERVQRSIAGAPEWYTGTTGDYGEALWVKNGQARTYQTIPNYFDERYEILSISEPLTVDVSCDGTFKLGFRVSRYYTKFIPLGGAPKEKPRKMSSEFKVEYSGTVSRDNVLLIKSCVTYEREDGAWAKQEDGGLLSACTVPHRDYRLFDIAPLVKGKKGWASVK